MENFMINVNGGDYFVNVIDDKDQILYEVRDATHLITTIGLNEDAEWEATTVYDAEKVKAFGAAIEDHEE